LKTVATLLSLTFRAAARPEDPFLGEAGRRLLSLLAFLVVGGISYLVSHLVSPPAGRFLLALTVGWNAAAILYLSLVTLYVRRGTPERTRRWAAARDAPRSKIIGAAFGRAVGLVFVVVATVAGFVTASGLSQGESGLLAGLSGLAVILAWLIVQASYGLYYAYLYYRKGPTGDPEGGLEFPGGEEPGLADFAYFAFAVGASFASSDVRVTATGIPGAW
jgi:uncharacterized membrane protein